MSRSRTLVAVVSGVVLSLALVSCSAQRPIPVRPVRSVTPTVQPAGDGVLRIGTLFPTTGAQSYLGGGQAAGVALAAKEINDAGGVLGKPVEVLARDSGDVTTTTIEASIADLVTANADVLIGPSSSVLAERVIPKLVAAKLPMVSPAATSVRLSSVASGGYFFRTIGSAALEGTALAKTIGAGKARIAIVYFDDDMGRAILGTLRTSLAASGGLVVAQKFDAATKDLVPIVAAVKTAAPDDVVFVSPFSAMEQNKGMIAQLTTAGLGGAKLWLTGQNTADYSQALPAGMVTNVTGIMEGAQPTAEFAARVAAVAPAVTDLLYAEEAYDATILAALAATVAKDANGSAIAAQLRDVSARGIECTTYRECLDVLKTSSDIDYDGISGATTFDPQGDTTPAHFGLYRYDAAGRFARVGDVIAD
jgi:ABC-type branched-subunit amino acid transport system substrate-binding protein